MPTTVVNINLGEPFEVYVGRAGRGWAGEFGNPFRLTPGGDRGTTLGKYQAWFLGRLKSDSDFRAKVEALRGKRLGCFCRPPGGFRDRLLCHAQVIAGWLDGVAPENVD